GTDSIGRADQKRLGQDTFEYLGVHFDARHDRLDRRGLEIEQAARRGADENELAAQPVRGQLSLQHILGGYITRGVAFVEMDEDLATLVGRNFEAAYGHRLHAVAGRVDMHD